ncbi:MAG TPA: CBS domain-containing protein [Chitinophagaceae bacterium]|nr:CBS domain-containing protein [Chitinophagaceae bacterium]
MLTKELPLQSFPTLQPSDKIRLALQLMNENQVSHLPIVAADKYIGIISEADLLQVDNDKMEIQTLEQAFGNASVRTDEHFLKAVQVAAENGLSLVPVVSDENDFIGAVSYNDLLRHASEFMSLHEPGGLVVLQIDSNQYSFNEISKLVESNDAQITQLNTSNDPEKGIMQVTIRVNKPDISDIVATFQRYEYNVIYYFGEEQYTNEIRSNYENLMNYLKL